MNPTETQAATRAAYVFPREEGVNDVWWPYVPGPRAGRHTNKVLGEQTEGRLFQTVVSYPRGAAPPLHIHHDADETFFVLGGEATIFVGDNRYECAVGDFVAGPKGVPHTFLVRSEWAEMLVSFSPAGIDRFFAEVAPAVIAGEPRPAAIDARPRRVHPPDGRPPVRVRRPAANTRQPTVKSGWDDQGSDHDRCVCRTKRTGRGTLVARRTGGDQGHCR